MHKGIIGIQLTDCPPGSTSVPCNLDPPVVSCHVPSTPACVADSGVFHNATCSYLPLNHEFKTAHCDTGPPCVELLVRGTACETQALVPVLHVIQRELESTDLLVCWQKGPTTVELRNSRYSSGEGATGQVDRAGAGTCVPSVEAAAAAAAPHAVGTFCGRLV